MWMKNGVIQQSESLTAQETNRNPPHLEQLS